MKGDMDMFEVTKIGDYKHVRTTVYSVKVSRQNETYFLIYDHYCGEWKWVPANDCVPVV